MKNYFTAYLFLLLAVPIVAQKNTNPYLRTSPEGRLHLTQAGASHFAALALACLQQEYPNKLNQTLGTGADLKEPHVLHPAFFGCYDWHSSVHGHWMLVRLLKQFPDLPQGGEIRKKLNGTLSAKNLQTEAANFRSASKSWERMYGWSWLLKLAEELATWDDADGKKWLQNLQPLTEAITERYLDFLPLQTYPVRTGVHPNTAFGLSFALDFANATGHAALKKMIEKRALDYYLTDTDCPADWEPSGEDFLSACLEEANLMRRVLPRKEFGQWFKHFLPKRKLAALMHPADVSDRSDPKIVHLDGLNLSRAWCMYGIYPFIKNKKQRKRMLEAAEKHLQATIPNIASEHYEGTHWLASFAVYALSAEG
ncbi:MAG TPA: DUF2891 domain-containing protein [Bacteroidetes bacterium]|nr:DUF2891 domain-containing protein [Bacteroidota bacterium]